MILENIITHKNPLLPYFNNVSLITVSKGISQKILDKLQDTKIEGSSEDIDIYKHQSDSTIIMICMDRLRTDKDKIMQIIKRIKGFCNNIAGDFDRYIIDKKINEYCKGNCHDFMKRVFQSVSHNGPVILLVDFDENPFII